MILNNQYSTEELEITISLLKKKVLQQKDEIADLKSKLQDNIIVSPISPQGNHQFPMTITDKFPYRREQRYNDLVMDYEKTQSGTDMYELFEKLLNPQSTSIPLELIKTALENAMAYYHDV